MARASRRRQALDALAFEAEREAKLAEQLEDVVAEADGARLDERLFAALEPGDDALVRSSMGASDDAAWEDLPTSDEAFVVFDDEEDETDTAAELEAEIERLREELRVCRERQAALRRYLDALGKG